MPPLTLDDATQIAVQHHQAGRLADAEKIYRQVLAQQPNHPTCLHLLGVIAHQVGRHDAAVELIRNAIVVRSNDPVYHANLGEALRALARLDEAIAAYTAALRLDPHFAMAYSNMGIALRDQQKLDDAVAACSKAIELKPDYAEAYVNLGNAFNAQGKFEEAVAAYSEALRLMPSMEVAHFNMGNALRGQKKLDGAIAAFSKAIAIKPNFVEAHINLGNVFHSQNKLEEAIAAFNRAVQLNPASAAAHRNLGAALRDQGRAAAAVAECLIAIQLEPNNPTTYTNLGNALGDQQMLDDAIAAHTKAIELDPRYAKAYSNLSNILSEQGKLDEAVAAACKAIELDPAMAAAHSNLGNFRKEQGLIDEALAAYDRAIALEPANASFGSNRLYALHLHPAYDPPAIAREHRHWNQLHAQPLKKFIHPHGNAHNANRRLRIGYVSPDFYRHPVGRFLTPLLENHSHGDFEIFCYSDTRADDDVTARLHAAADAWRPIAGMSDERVAQMIRHDQVDVLVDLAMHLAGNRLLVFARKPAPVQVTYLAYCSTTGLDTIDYRLTDPHLDPPDQDDAHYAEQSWRLPDSYWCYAPHMEIPPVAPLPAAGAGHVTFGCLNNFAKASPVALTAWCRALRQVPDSRLILHAKQGSHRQRIIELLRQEGVNPDRLTFVSHAPGQEYFRLYHQIDIALDPFPCAGGTTTCDALWMGVPVITLAGKTAVGRCGASILTNAGLPELVAATEDQYIELASHLAADLPRLAALRATLRQRMAQSPLMDAPPFARNIEAAYREMWRRRTVYRAL